MCVCVCVCVCEMKVIFSPGCLFEKESIVDNTDLNADQLLAAVFSTWVSKSHNECTKNIISLLIRSFMVMWLSDKITPYCIYIFRSISTSFHSNIINLN